MLPWLQQRSQPVLGQWKYATTASAKLQTLFSLFFASLMPFKRQKRAVRPKRQKTICLCYAQSAFFLKSFFTFLRLKKTVKTQLSFKSNIIFFSKWLHMFFHMFFFHLMFFSYVFSSYVFFICFVLILMFYFNSHVIYEVQRYSTTRYITQIPDYLLVSTRRLYTLWWGGWMTVSRSWDGHRRCCGWMRV